MRWKGADLSVDIFLSTHKPPRYPTPPRRHQQAWEDWSSLLSCGCYQYKVSYPHLINETLQGRAIVKRRAQGSHDSSLTTARILLPCWSLEFRQACGHWATTTGAAATERPLSSQQTTSTTAKTQQLLLGGISVLLRHIQAVESPHQLRQRTTFHLVDV